jgi:hypothetical protein
MYAILRNLTHKMQVILARRTNGPYKKRTHILFYLITETIILKHHRPKFDLC